jgi:hypothetical protein
VENLNQKSPESTADKAINIAAILAIAYLSSILSHAPFAEAFGGLLVFGIFGMGIYRLIDKLIFKNKFSNTQSKFRQYAIGCVIISIFLVPMSIKNGEEKLKKDQNTFSIGESLGKLYVSCELSKHLSANYCQKLQLNPEFIKLCSSDIGSLHLPSKPEFDATVSSDKIKFQLKDLKEGMGKNIEIAKTQPNYSDEKLCDLYKSTLNKTYEDETRNVKNKSQ